MQASKRRRLYRCGRKIGFTYAADARQALASLIARGETRLHVYKHARCQGYHVGHFQ
ncbi:MAG: hypothetical protein AB1631_34520 [Acidobacteriota bacterium]